jgi:hypothetical protein
LKLSDLSINSIDCAVALSSSISNTRISAGPAQRLFARPSALNPSDG